ncbi:phosphoglycerate mutase-like protein 4 [Eucalyptus grandis]|uniref:phosphoglycerate mutase-like protein 4 n=1 Tax=Eucalyptus grandis TaxID=71139 RepID=UPI00192E7F6A|nr:phosphoglycerate mutase-like protein 4 [Eucalyptus grandis]
MGDAVHTAKSVELGSREAVELNDDRDAQSVHPSADHAEIVLIRHGQTDWNVDRRIQGQSDVKLNEVGRQQTRAVADRLFKEREISAIYSSDLKRAIETAEVIAAACGVREVIKDPDLRVQNPGKLQGLSSKEAASLYPQIYEAYRSRSCDQEMPDGGESKYQVYQRCTSCLQNIGLKHKGERVAVVTHGTVHTSIYLQARPNEGPSPKVQNGSISILHLFSRDDWVVKSWGDHSHLNQTEEKL